MRIFHTDTYKCLQCGEFLGNQALPFTQHNTSNQIKYLCSKCEKAMAEFARYKLNQDKKQQNQKRKRRVVLK